MTELSIVPKGALLIRNGIIQEVGPSRRVENLAGARGAREIDATGRVIMPAFVDADVALVSPAAKPCPVGIRLTSRRKALARAAAAASECAHYGCLAVGAHTRCAADLQNIRKVLRVHQALQGKPMRIRSIFSPQFPPADALISKWLPAVWSKKLARIVELAVDGPDGALDNSMLRAAAVAAQQLGYAIRLRSSRHLEPAGLKLALEAGALGIVAPMDTLRSFAEPLAAVGCIRVIPASEGFDDAANAAAALRGAIDQGAAVALTSSYRLTGTSSLNMQYLLHLAVHRLGLTPEEAITATTWNPACSLRMSHVAGSLEPGRSADLLLMEVSDYRELPRRAGHHDISLVMRAGQILMRSPALNVD